MDIVSLLKGTGSAQRPPDTNPLTLFCRINPVRNQIRADLGERFQDEGAAEHPGVGENEISFADRDLVVVEQVEISSAGSIHFALGRSPEFALDGLGAGEELERG